MSELTICICILGCMKSGKKRLLWHLIVDYVNHWFFLITNILRMGAWGDDIPLSDVDLSLNKVTGLLWYKKKNLSHGVLL